MRFFPGVAIGQNGLYWNRESKNQVHVIIDPEVQVLLALDVLS